MRKDNIKSGISLVVLIITIAVMITLAAVVIISVRDNSSDTVKVSFISDITQIEDALNSYYIANDILPIESGTSLYTKSQVLDLVDSAYKDIFIDELKLNNDYSDTENVVFYPLNINEIGVMTSSKGNKKLGDNDRFFFAYPSFNVYYLYGEKIGDDVYFSLSSRITTMSNKNNNSSANVGITYEYNEGITIPSTIENFGVSDNTVPSLSFVKSNNYENSKVIKINVDDNESGLKQIRYDYLKRAENGREVLYYDGVDTFSDEYMLTQAKSANISNLKNESVYIKVPPEVTQTEVMAVDNADNKSRISIITDAISNSPVIPNGFKHIDGTIETGFVIQNEKDGNEFVWVPVNDFEEFKSEEGYGNGVKQDLIKNGVITEPLNYHGVEACQEEKDEYELMCASVKEYGGFYIARYEASNDGSNNAQSKPNCEPWRSLNWGADMNDLDGDGAAGKSRAVYPKSKATQKADAISTLIYGVQWDATIRWLKINYPGIDIDSKNYGNYADPEYTYISIDNVETLKAEGVSKRIPTGSSEHNKTNNIYDMAGNILEWTMEANGDARRTLCGGNYYGKGMQTPISCRGADVPDSGLGYFGFRFALYIK